jgi:hypothetical protein
MDSANENGAYKFGKNNLDCFCSIIFSDGPAPCYDCVCNSMAGTICLPLAIPIHLFCLPIMCCYCTRTQWDESDCCTGSCLKKDKSEVNNEVKPIEKIKYNYSGTSTYHLPTPNIISGSSNLSNSSNYPGKEFSDMQMNYYKGQIMMNQANYNRTFQAKYSHR